MMEFDITAGPRLMPLKVVLYGPEGIGKSTFASKFPNPLFIDTEDSTVNMDVRRFSKPTDWQDLFHMIDYVREHKDICSTLVIDTADWAERLCEKAVCIAGHKASIEDFGYGKGYTMAAEEFGKMLDALSDLATKAQVNVVLTAHSIIRKFERPDEMGAYDRYELKLGNKAGSKCSALAKEWCDLLLFANYKEVVTEVNGKKKAQGGRRVMYTSHHPCWDAKNRLGLTDELPFDIDSISNFIVDFHSMETLDMKPEVEASKKASAERAGREAEAAKQELLKNSTPVSNKKALEIEQTVFDKSPKKAVESLSSEDATKTSKGDKKDAQTRAVSLQEKVLSNAEKAGVTALELASWAVSSGCLAKDEKAFPKTGGVMPVEKWPDGFIKDVIIPNWGEVVKAAKIKVPF